jgi:hypothetical protein
MGRIVKQIEIEGQPATALFDTGANYTYVRADLVQNAPRRRMSPPITVALGGQEIEI